MQVTSCVKGQNFICLSGRKGDDGSLVVFVNVYAPCDRAGKVDLWNSLIGLKNSIGIDDWCVLGDFNAVRCPEERKGQGNSSSTQRLESSDFNQFIEGMELLDIPLIGRRFTWMKPNGLQMSRLDRILVTSTWIDSWPGFSQEVLPRDISDHCPLLLRNSNQNWGPKPFRFLNCWFDDPRFKGFVLDTWRGFQIDGWGAYVLKEKLKNLKTCLNKWNIETFGDLNRRKKEIVEKINELEKKAESGDLRDDELKQRKEWVVEFWRCSKQIESLASQKAKVKWVKEGDANTKFFHTMVNYKRKKNSLLGLHINGEWCEEPRLVKEEVRNFFSQKFRSVSHPLPLLDGVPFSPLSADMSQSLEVPFSADELRDAVWDCAGEKSPGPDGVNFKFIKHFWDILKVDFSRMAEEFHQNGVWPRGTNASFISLIPKIDNPQGLNDFRPISLVNCMYKVLSKLLANRLKGVMSSIIDECQFAFVGGKNMLDSVLIANEVFHEAKRNKLPTFLLKIDYEKAYDSVNWGFLIYMLGRLNFGERWIKWVKNCLSSSSISVLVNGSPTEEFAMERGLRQGDPLAPFLFIIVAEGLSGLMKQAVAYGKFTPFKFCGDNGPEVSMLQFADDTIIMGKASVENLFAVKTILRCFELCAGLKVNFFKSKLSGVGVDSRFLNSSSSMLHCQQMQFPVTYLGLPVGGNPRRLVFWDPVLNKLRKRLSSWKQRHLSFGGRLCLLKAVLSSIPLYYLSFYKMPVGILTECNKIMRRFLWGGLEGGGKIAWVEWSKICRPKAEGGLGVKDLRLFNWALLGKWRWRLLKERSSLWCRILISKYNDAVHPNDSYWWRDLHSVCFGDGDGRWFNDSISRRVGDGKVVSFWQEDWTGGGSLCNRFPRLFILSSHKEASIHEVGLWDNGSWEWRFEWTRPLLDRESSRIAELLLQIGSFSPKVGVGDSWCWVKDGSGSYSVKSAYAELLGDFGLEERRVFRRIWHAKAPSGLLALAWRIIIGRVQTRSDLARRNSLPANASLECGLCGSVEECCQHLFFDCQVSWRVWMKIYNWLGIQTALPNNAEIHFNLHENLLMVSKKFWMSMDLIWIAAVSAIWQCRNGAVFRGESVETDRIVELVQFKVWLWLRSNESFFVSSCFEWIMNPVECLRMLH